MESLDELLEKASEAVKRDITHIMVQVSQKKLPPTSARDLVAYVKLLTELNKLGKKDEEALQKHSEEELKQLAKELLKGN